MSRQPVTTFFESLVMGCLSLGFAFFVIALVISVIGDWLGAW